MDEGKKFYKEYDVIRILATVLVVIGHSAYVNMYTDYGGIGLDVNFSSIQKYIDLFVRVIYIFHMQLFVALSGSLYFLSMKRDSNQEIEQPKFVDLLKNKFVRLIVPLLLVFFLYELPIKIISGYYSESKNIWLDIFIGQLFLFDNNYLWYLLSLFWIFLVYWLLKKFIKNDIVILIIGIAFFVAQIFIPQDYLAVKSFLNYFMWFVIGGLYEKHREGISAVNRKQKWIKYVFILLTMVAYIIYYLFFENIEYIRVFLSAFCVVTIYLWCNLFSESKINYRKCVILKYSFRIYLFSDPLNYLIIKVLDVTKISRFYSSAWFCVTIFCFRILFTLSVALLISFIISRLKVCLQKKRKV